MTDLTRELPAIPAITDVQEESVEENDTLDYNPETGTYRASFDGSSETVCQAVVSMVSAISKTNPTELPPLGETIDPDALGAVLYSSPSNQSQGDVHVTFWYADYEVTVHSYGIVAVRPGEE